MVIGRSWHETWTIFGGDVLVWVVECNKRETNHIAKMTISCLLGQKARWASNSGAAGIYLYDDSIGLGPQTPGYMWNIKKIYTKYKLARLIGPIAISIRPILILHTYFGKFGTIGVKTRSQGSQGLGTWNMKSHVAYQRARKELTNWKYEITDGCIPKSS